MSILNGVIYCVGGFMGTTAYREANRGEGLGLSAFSARTGRPIPWNPTADRLMELVGNGRLKEPINITGILATHGQVLVGGADLSGLSGFAAGFAAFDAHTGRLLPWSKRVGGYASIFAVSGNTVYLGAPYDYLTGGLTSAGGRPAHSLAAVVLPSGKFTSWRPMLSPAPSVTALAASGQKVLVATSESN
jgi:hypothetical protein